MTGRTLKWLRLSAAPAIVALVGLIATGIGAFLIDSATESRERASFESAVDQANGSIEARLGTYVAVLRAASGLFAASDEVTSAEFRRFAEHVEIRRRYPGIQGIGFSLRIPPGQERAVEARMRAQGASDFRIEPPSRPGTETHAILYLQPQDARNHAAMGFNMHSEARRAEAMDRARDTGQPALSGKVILRQEIDSDRQAGFLIYKPVYSGDAAMLTSVEARREHLLGFVYAPFRAGDLLRTIMAEINQQRLAYAVYDGPPVQRNLLFHDGSDVDLARARFWAERTVSVAGRNWTVRYYADPQYWPASDRILTLAFIAGGLVAALIGGWAMAAQVRAREAAEREIALRAVAATRQKLLLDELNHRVKNTLATVQSVASQSLRNARDIGQGRRDFEARLLSLSKAHNLLTLDNWRGASLADLAETELEPYRSAGAGRVKIEGEEVWLAPNTAVAMGMAFHELATNAAKYGALSAPQGRVMVTWKLTRPEHAPRRLVIRWIEADGPEVRPPERRGFGSRLLLSGLAHQLNGEVDLDFRKEGVRCTITFNLHEDTAPEKT